MCRLMDISVLEISVSKPTQAAHASDLCGKIVVWPCSDLMPKSSANQIAMELPDGAR